uniref:Transmembrane protein n=1 Tax=Solanum tuberosum TaxID=4113 RepID=M1CT58_SOLTU
MTVGFSGVHRKRRRGVWIWWQLVVLLFVWFGGVSGGCVVVCMVRWCFRWLWVWSGFTGNEVLLAVSDRRRGGVLRLFVLGFLGGCVAVVFGLFQWGFGLAFRRGRGWFWDGWL